MFNWLRGLVSGGAEGSGAKDRRVKERQGRPRTDQGFTKDGKKDMRGRPQDGSTLYKDGTK
jgi:hypothetical protein